MSLSVSEARVHSSLQVFSVQLAYPVSPFLDREQFVCPTVHEIGEGDSGDGGGKIESRCTGGAQIESWVQPWRFPRLLYVHSVFRVQIFDDDVQECASPACVTARRMLPSRSARLPWPASSQ